MKYLNWLSIVFLVSIAAAYYFISPFRTAANVYLYQSPCDSSIAYQLGSIDPRFNLSRDQLQGDINQATDIWSQAYGKKLFIYDPTTKFKVNLVFDERQGLSNQIGSMESNLQSQQQQITPEIAKYQSDVAAFQKRVADLNAQIASWNGRGGAPKDVYDQLVKQQQDLRAQADALNAEAKSLNQSTYQFNSQVGSLNQTINAFNNTLVDKPEEGLYDPNADKIDIFFNTNHDELVHTLAHEFGHALGMVHVTDITAIMNARSNKNTTLTPDDKAELTRVCMKIPVWEIWSKKLAEYIFELRNGQLQTGKGA